MVKQQQLNLGKCQDNLIGVYGQKGKTYNSIMSLFYNK